METSDGIGLRKRKKGELRPAPGPPRGSYPANVKKRNHPNTDWRVSRLTAP